VDPSHGGGGREGVGGDHGSLFVRATPVVISTCPCKLKSEEKKLKHVGLAQQKWFWANIGPHFAEAGNENCKRRV